ncbi:hypothetical protein [Tindallia californiensis]|nr:hypothetical protein [Tindallia californiensis]
MSEAKCEHPERLKGKKPGECSEKQKEICHGHESKQDQHSSESEQTK